MGMLLESRTVRRVLGTAIGRRESTAELPTYRFSFNPLPALVFAVVRLLIR